MSLFCAKTVQQRPLLPREVEIRLPDCEVTHWVRVDHLLSLRSAGISIAWTVNTADKSSDDGAGQNAVYLALPDRPKL